MFIFLVVVLLFVILFVDFFFKWRDSDSNLQRLIAWFCAISVVLLGILAVYSFILKKPLPLFDPLTYFMNRFQ